MKIIGGIYTKQLELRKFYQVLRSCQKSYGYDQK